MAVTIVRPETGAAVKPGPMITVSPLRGVQDDSLKGFAAGTGLNGPFLADNLSAFVAHERMALDLLRTLHSRTDNPVMHSRYSELQDQTRQAIETWENLIQNLGGNPQYISPPARMAEAFDTKVVESLALSGSADPMTFEEAGLHAFLSAAHQSGVHADLLAAFAEEADEGRARQMMTAAAQTLSTTAAAHLEWAAQALRKMAVIQVKHPMAQKAGQVAEKVVGAVRDAVGRG